MEQHQIEELNKLKSLLDSGILTQEEFEAEKAKILVSSNLSQTIETKDNDMQSISSDNCKSPSQQGKPNKRRIAIIAAVIFSAVLIIAIIGLCKNTGSQSYDSNNETADANTVEAVNPSDADVANDDESINTDNFVQEGSDEDFEINCPWRKEYFHNDFGEDMPEHPYIVTSIVGSWNLEIAYSHEMGFRFALRDNDGEYQHMYSPISIIFRTKDGNTYEIAPDNVENYCAFIQSSDNVKDIAQILETQSKFDILMYYQMYNEPHKMTWKVDDLGGTFMFNKAVEKYL